MSFSQELKRSDCLAADVVADIASTDSMLRKSKQFIERIIARLEDTSLVWVTAWFSKRYWNKRVTYDYQPSPGRRSSRAEDLVDFCLGDFKDRPIVPCSGDFFYLKGQELLLLEAGPKDAVLSNWLHHSLRDQKMVVRALKNQQAVIPDGLRCWLVRDDDAGSSTVPEQGLHITGMRRACHRHLVLVPTANRNRFLGPNLENQMEELRQSWVPWDAKSDTAWWGGAMTGEMWQKNKPRTLTRQEVLCYFRDNPSEQVRLHLTKIPNRLSRPRGVKLNEGFTKKSAFTHKCLVLLAGNDIASGSSWYFAGNSVVLMPRPHLEHILYYEMNPWEHFVPLENDPADILVKLKWVLDNQDEARQIVDRSHERLRWLCGPEYLWACNEVLRRIARPPVDSTVV